MMNFHFIFVPSLIQESWKSQSRSMVCRSVSGGGNGRRATDGSPTQTESKTILWPSKSEASSRACWDERTCTGGLNPAASLDTGLLLPHSLSEMRFLGARTVALPFGVITATLVPILEILPRFSCGTLGFLIRTLLPTANSQVAVGLWGGAAVSGSPTSLKRTGRETRAACCNCRS